MYNTEQNYQTHIIQRFSNLNEKSNHKQGEIKNQWCIHELSKWAKGTTYWWPFPKKVQKIHMPMPDNENNSLSYWWEVVGSFPASIIHNILSLPNWPSRTFIKHGTDISDPIFAHSEILSCILMY